jgi:hypothetical protein
MVSVIPQAVEALTSLVRNGQVDLYNEASVQYELAILLRYELGGSYKVQLERNIDYFELDKAKFIKKEMDIVLFRKDLSEKSCIEIKFPTNGQHPEQMFKACKDIAFLEELKGYGFSQSYFLMLADDHLFYNDKGGKEEIYRLFRENKVIHGDIQKPTGKRDELLRIQGSYYIKWNDVHGTLKYALIEI